MGDTLGIAVGLVLGASVGAFVGWLLMMNSSPSATVFMQFNKAQDHSLSSVLSAAE